MYKNNKTFTAMDARKGSVEDGGELPAIENYANTLWVFENRRKIEKEHYKLEDLEAYDHYFSNLTELSREMYDFYIADPDSGEVYPNNLSYVIIFGTKDDQSSVYLGSAFG
jgi:hypothetical protein